MLEVCQVAGQALAGGLHAADDLAQALRLREAAVVVIEGVWDVLLPLRGRPRERWRLRHIPEPHSLPSSYVLWVRAARSSCVLLVTRLQVSRFDLLLNQRRRKLDTTWCAQGAIQIQLHRAEYLNAIQPDL